MNKKIKSVKLAKDYRTQFCEIKAGAVLERNVSNPEYFLLNSQTVQGVKYATTSFFERDMLDCKTGLFEIEYEEEDEHFVFTGYPVCDYNIFFKNYLNALADWCDEKFIIKGFKPTKLENPCVITYNQFSDALEWAYKIINRHSGNLVLNSNESAQLFIAELNRNENKAVKEYFINLLKSERLR